MLEPLEGTREDQRHGMLMTWKGKSRREFKGVNNDK